MDVSVGGRDRFRPGASQVTVSALETPIRRGAGYWWSSYVAMLRWVLTQQKVLFIGIVFTQIVMGIGAAFMYRFYLGSVDPVTAVYLVSGIPALSMIPVGFVMVPILVMQEKSRGTHEFTWSLPVPRLAPVASTFTVFTAISMPIAAASTFIAAVQFDVDLQVSWTVLPFALLVSLMATSVGYGMAMAIPEPRVTNLITNVVIFLVLWFSPIVIPIDRYPDWASVLHRALPFFHMSNLIRSGLTEGLATETTSSLAILLLWTVLGWAAVARVVARRG
jgi:ABC-2 type transport system permease protein